MKLKEHLALRNLYLQHANLEDFLTSKCKSATPYVCWRLFWAVYHLSWFIGDITVTSLEPEACVAKWFIYLSNWMYMILTLECVMEAIVLLKSLYKKPENGHNGRLPWYIQMLWVLYNLSVTGAVMVSLWYWTFIHKGRELTAVRFNTHAVSALYILLNMAVTRFPLRLLHFLYPVAFGVIYTLFSGLYFCLGGTNKNGEPYIYSILDWSRPGRTLAISSLSNFVFIPTVHILLWALSLCLQKIYDRCRQNRVVYSQDLGSVSGSTDGQEVILG